MTAMMTSYDARLRALEERHLRKEDGADNGAVPDGSDV